MRSTGVIVALAAVGMAPVAALSGGEYGGVYSPQVSQDESPWVLVELEGDYESPVLFGAVPSDSGDDETVVRFTYLRPLYLPTRYRTQRLLPPSRYAASLPWTNYYQPPLAETVEAAASLVCKTDCAKNPTKLLRR